MELVEAVFYKKINPGDLLNIDRALHAGGGGQTYLDLAGVSQAGLCRFLEYGTEMERLKPPEGDTRRKFSIQAIAIGTDESKRIEFDPRNHRPNYKLSDQRANRHPAWTQRFGFPVSPPGARYARDVTNIPYLLVYIIRTDARKYYAGFVNVPEMPAQWPAGVGLEQLFTGERKGVYFFEQSTIAFHNDPSAPFSLLPAAGAPAAGITALPADETEFPEEELPAPEARDLVFTEQPVPAGAAPVPRQDGPVQRQGRRVDYVRVQRNKAAIGRAGERAALEYEKRRLCSLGYEELSRQVEWVSETQGDGLGYDIRSFDVVDGRAVDRYLEVKTTTGAIDKPFDVSLNEAAFSSENPESFVLFRIFEFSPRSEQIHFYQVRGSLSEHFCLSAASYLASLPRD